MLLLVLSLLSFLEFLDQVTVGRRLDPQDGDDVVFQEPLEIHYHPDAAHILQAISRKKITPLSFAGEDEEVAKRERRDLHDLHYNRVFGVFQIGDMRPPDHGCELFQSQVSLHPSCVVPGIVLDAKLARIAGGKDPTWLTFCCS